MAIEIGFTGHGVANYYRSIAPSHEYAILRITQNDGNYDYTTIVNTNMIAELKHFLWYHQCTNNVGVYISCSINGATQRVLDRLGIHVVGKTLLFHRFIAGAARLPNEDPENAIYVDHINRMTLDNRIENLRWATQSEQNRNQNKKTRQRIARPLPTDIEQAPLPKYINWNSETNGQTGTVRTFFRIECHPALDGKQWSTSKSGKVSNQEKLNQAKKKLLELDALVNPDPDEPLRKRLTDEFNTLLEAV